MQLYSKIGLFVVVGLLLGWLTSCTPITNNQPAPIVNGWHSTSGRQSYYMVQRGDTLYSVAWAFDMDYRDLARINHVAPPYRIQTGQRLRMAAAAPTPSLPSKAVKVTLPQRAASKPTARPTPTILAKKTVPIPPTSRSVERYPTPTHWQWPATGRVIRGFHPVPGGNKGINIAGALGGPVLAAEAGKVVYCGANLPGYGNLIIIKHSEHYLSAYADNRVLLVREGQTVKAGQVIAHVGTSDNGRAELHFEIRFNGKPIDPLSMLKAKRA